MHEPFTIPRDALPATASALARKQVTILVLGGAAAIGAAAHGKEYTYPARLAARLQQAFPEVTFNVIVDATPRQPMADALTGLDSALAKRHPALVIWGLGASAAARGDDLDSFISDVNEAIHKVRAAGADLIFMTLQYAPSVARLINLPPYRMAVINSAEMAGVPVLDRYELMRFWNSSDFLNLDATGREDRIKVARRLYGCLAELLAGGVEDAVR
ncbi:MAG: hypothetical protein AB7F35_07205 [Acetobacteraceae bacterium]